MLFAQEVIEGSATILILRDGGTLIAARDRMGRIPVMIGKSEDGYCVTFESFAAEKLGYELEKELADVKFCKINVDTEPELARAFNVSSIPMLAFVKDNTFADLSVGYVPKAAIAKKIEDNR